MRTRLLLAAALLALCVDARAQTPVPPSYQDLYTQLASDVGTFKSTVDQSWNGSRSAVTFGANLNAADSNRGPALLGPTADDAVRLELDSLKALGVTAVTIHVSFPILYAPFYQNLADYQQYVNFYTQVVADVRARGLALVVETEALFPSYVPSWNLAAYYAGLTLMQYEQGRTQMAQVIAETLHPDYLVVVEEPDTEALQTGQAGIGTAAGSTALVTQIVGALKSDPAADGVRVGAGIGTWITNYADYVNGYASTAVDFLDMHVYPANNGYLARALDIANIAAGYGKPVGVSEAWLFKVRDSELGAIDAATILSRDTFSFWAPLDSEFLQAMVEMAEWKQLAFMSPFNSGYFHAYLDYNGTTAALSAPALLQAAAMAQATSTGNGTYTSTGLGFETAILAAPDTIAPTTVSNLSAQFTSATSVLLQWTAASDNVGPAAYQVFRNGTPLGQTAMQHFADSGLADAHTYTYSIATLDAAGNVSPAASATIATPDTTPPSTPAGLNVAAAQVASAIDLSLSWQASSDNVGVTAYHVYEGALPGALRPIASVPNPSYVLFNVAPQTTMYFAVSAFDAAGNESLLSAPVAITTPLIADVTPPNVVVMSPAAGAQVRNPITVTASAWDVPGGTFDQPSGIAGVQFQVDGVNAGPEQTVPYAIRSGSAMYQYTLSRLSRGAHVLTAVARDRAGNRTVSAPVSITVKSR